MSDPSPSPRVISFGAYQCDIAHRELRKNGVKIKIADQPFRLLATLLERPGEMFTRQELEERLWAGGTFVGFEDSLNTAVNKLRKILEDESENPRFIETIPRKGYRFVWPITEVSGSNSQSEGSTAAIGRTRTDAAVEGASPSSKRSRTGFASVLVFVGVALVIFGGLADWLLHGRPALSFNQTDSVLITDFENQTGEARFDYALGTAFRVSLEQSRQVNVFPHDQLEPALQMMGKDAGEKITRGVGREICERENIRALIAASITRTGQEYEIAVQLIDPQTDQTVRAYSERSDDEDHLLDALDKISGELRQDLGESLYQIHRAEMPLEQVTTPSLQALRDYSNGKLLWQTDKYHDAVASFQSAVAIDPNFAMANAALGAAYYSFIYNQYDEGQKYYEKALASASRVTPREREIIETNYTVDRGHVPDAIALYERYLQDYPNDLGMRFGYARLLRKNGRATDGIAQDREILRITPNDARTYIDMATAYHTIGKLSDSLAAYNKAFEIEPQMRVAGDINREYGFTLVQSGQLDDAERLFSNLSNDPGFQEQGFRSLAFLDLYRGNYRNAEQYLERALKIDEGTNQTFAIARVRYLMALAASGEGRRLDQIHQLDEIMKVFPELEEKVAYGAFVGQAYARAGETAKAENILRQVAPLADRHSQVQMCYLDILRAEIADAEGKNGQALQLLEPLQTNGSRSNTTPILLDSLGRTYQEAGNVGQAISFYAKLATLPGGCTGWEPQQQCLEDRYILAEDYAKTNQTAKAMSTIEALLSLWKNADPGLPLKENAARLQSNLSHRQ